MRIRQISIIDDDQKHQEFLRKLLGDYFDVAAFQYSRAFLANKAFLHTDLLITELKIADINGFELMEKVRAVRPDLPVIILSERNDERSIKKAYQLGALAFFSKPLDYERLKNDFISIKHATS
jgi:DNA-binding NtrC family response regulator